MSDTRTYIDAFKAFESSLNGQTSTPLHQIRRRAIESFEGNGFPTSKDEAWKSINLSSLTGEFKTAESAPLPASALSDLGYNLDTTLVFVNGQFDEAASRVSDQPDGLTVSSFAKEIASGNSLLDDHVSEVAPFDTHAFTALNTAFLTDGALVHAARGVVSESPIHVVYVSTADTGEVAYPRSLFIAEENSQVTIVETFLGLSDGPYLTNHVSELIAGDNAILDHYKVGLEGPDALHVSNQQSRQGRASNLRSHSISIGGQFVRNNVSSALDGEACESTINGLYVLNGSQHCDNYTLLEHCKPNCPSHELYKGILGDEARAIFRGKIHVHQIAQKTDAYQQNQNILLSDDARVNTKPQLEIYADDVKCSHGATIGQIDEDALFYLGARGINRETAHRMLLEAFANDLLSRIKIESLKDGLTDRILTKIASNG
ncbi:MAG: Fe-S cluster assembly protein SufD [Gemmatimonadetes bacterium]|nr:Fe-S cluster assembly protein SufD [Gemmatimonadota bacterium]